MPCFTVPSAYRTGLFDPAERSHVSYATLSTTPQPLAMPARQPKRAMAERRFLAGRPEAGGLRLEAAGSRGSIWFIAFERMARYAIQRAASIAWYVRTKSAPAR